MESSSSSSSSPVTGSDPSPTSHLQSLNPQPLLPSVPAGAGEIGGLVDDALMPGDNDDDSDDDDDDVAGDDLANVLRDIENGSGLFPTAATEAAAAAVVVGEGSDFFDIIHITETETLLDSAASSSACTDADASSHSSSPVVLTPEDAYEMRLYRSGLIGHFAVLLSLLTYGPCNAPHLRHKCAYFRSSPDRFDPRANKMLVDGLPDQMRELWRLCLNCGLPKIRHEIRYSRLIEAGHVIDSTLASAPMMTPPMTSTGPLKSFSSLLAPPTSLPNVQTALIQSLLGAIHGNSPLQFGNDANVSRPHSESFPLPPTVDRLKQLRELVDERMTLRRTLENSTNFLVDRLLKGQLDLKAQLEQREQLEQRIQSNTDALVKTSLLPRTDDTYGTDFLAIVYPHSEDFAGDHFEWSGNLEANLQRVFGHRKFRPLQQQVINAAMENRDCFVVMPTGGGKYSIGAWMAERERERERRDDIYYSAHFLLFLQELCENFLTLTFPSL